MVPLILEASGEGERGPWAIGRYYHPTMAEILAVLERCCIESGSIELRVDDDEDEAPLLQLEAKAGNYMLALEDDDEDGDGVRFLIDPDVPDGMPFDDEFPADTITTNFQSVLQVFLEFIHTGNVSTELMA